MNLFTKSLLLLLTLTVFTSCEKDGIHPHERLIYGEWKIEKVHFCEGLFSREDVTEDFGDISVTFYKDYSLEYLENGILKTGKWEYDVDSYSGGEETVTTQRVLGTLLDPVSNEVELLNWEEFRVNKRRICFNINDHQSSFEYRLVKQ